MTTPHPPHAPETGGAPCGPIEVRRRRRGRARALLALGSVLGLGLVATSAAFSDSATVTAGFTAGTLDLTVDGEQGNPTPYAVAFAGAGEMVPGQTVHAPLVLANVGTVDAELSMTTSITPDGTTPNATDDLRMTVVETTGSACDAGVIAADPTPLVADGPLAAAAFSDLALDGGEDHELCVAVTLPASVTGTGGGATDLELRFTAAQAGI